MTVTGEGETIDTRARAELEREAYLAGTVEGLGGARDLPLDGHLHTVRSPDADAQLESYCALAVERGIAEIAITDHVDFERGAPAYAFTTFADRERTVRAAAILVAVAGHGLSRRSSAAAECYAWRG